jgi:hypothetical protein
MPRSSACQIGQAEDLAAALDFESRAPAPPLPLTNTADLPPVKQSLPL